MSSTRSSNLLIFGECEHTLVLHYLLNNHCNDILLLKFFSYVNIYIYNVYNLYNIYNLIFEQAEVTNADINNFEYLDANSLQVMFLL